MRGRFSRRFSSAKARVWTIWNTKRRLTTAKMNAAAAACGRRRRHARAFDTHKKKIKPSWWSHLSRRLAVDDDWTLPGRSKGDLLQSHLAHALHVLRDPAFAHAFEFRKSPPQILLIVVFRGGSVVLLSRGGRRGEPPHRQSGIVDCDGHFLVLFFVRTRKAAIFFALFLAGKIQRERRTFFFIN